MVAVLLDDLPAAVILLAVLAVDAREAAEAVAATVAAPVVVALLQLRTGSPWHLPSSLSSPGSSALWSRIKKYESAPAWFEFLLFLFLALMVILGGFGIGNLDGFLEEYLQLTISMLGKGVLLILFCCRVYANRWGWFERKDSSSSAVFHTLASLLCCIAASLAILVLLVGLGVAK